MLSQPLLQNAQVLDRRYQIKGLLATGGVGHTYLAEDTKRPGNPVCVVKHLKSNSPGILKKARELFAREGEELENLGKHPQIPRLLAYFEEDGEFYLVQEYIQGRTLAQEFEAQQILSETQVINLLSELLEILKFVHANEVIHRDIKPANIICRKQDGKLVLIDFGAVKKISTLENPATIICTQGYAPPEQRNGEPSICSDIYAVGIIGIQALTAIHPGLDSYEGGFEFNEQGEIIWQHRAKVSQTLADILSKMVRQNEQERYQSVREVLQELQPLKQLTLDQQFKDIDSIIKLVKPVPFQQKLKLPLSLVIGILMIGFISISLAKKLSLMCPITYGSQLCLNGQTVEGILHSNSRIEPIKNTYYDVYLLQGRKDKQVTIEMKSDEFDPALTILNSDRQIVAINDDISPQNFNSQIVVTLPEDGNYQVIVRASVPGEIGNYQLKASVE
ncbi:MAG: protein kinase [Xenococcaceae cyanobacterium MO_207.B15]|nr:protein kinase [Xenococcaceae cyanobacterium MO_207.B15]